MSKKSLFVLACVFSMLVMGAAASFDARAADTPRIVSEHRILLAQAERATGNRSDEAEMHNEQGNTLAAQGRYREAIPHYNEAIDIDPKNAKAFNNRGVAYANMGRYDRAISDYTRALELNPNFAQAYHNRAISHFRSKDYSQSCADLKRFRQMGGMPSPEFVQDLESVSGKGQC